MLETFGQGPICSFRKSIVGSLDNGGVTQQLGDYLGKKVNNKPLNEETSHPGSKLDKYLIYGFSIAFIIVILTIAIAFPSPTPFQYTVFRIVLALFSAGVAAMIPGVIDVNLTITKRNYIRAGGAIAIFVIIYFYSPAALVLNPK